MTVDLITKYILEQEETSGVPKELAELVLKKLKEKSISKVHNDVMKDIKRWGTTSDYVGTDKKIVEKVSKDTNNIIKNYSLIGVYPSVSGDFFFYSLKDSNIYVWDHETSSFIYFVNKKGKIPLKTFITLVKKDKEHLWGR